MNRINIGIVGLNFGRRIIEQELASGAGLKHFRIAAVCDIDAAKAGAIGSAIGADVYTDLEALLADRKIPAIGLFTGPAGRAELIRKIIRAGKHVITTKPFEADPRQALDVLREARSLGLAVHLNSPAPLLSEDLRQIRDWQEKLGLGAPIGCRIETWAAYREKADGGWQDDHARCPVAPVFRLGIYLINDLIALIGEPESVQVLHSRILTERPTPDNAQLGIRFRNGALANVFASFCIDDSQHYSNALTLNFENGTVYRNVGKALFNDGIPGTHLAFAATRPRPATGRAVVLENSGSYQWKTFYRAVSGEKLADEITPEQIVAGLNVIEAMARAEKSGRTEQVS